MNKLAAVLALLTFLIAGGFGLYGQSTYERLKSQEEECELPGADPLCGFSFAYSSALRMYQAESTRNVGFGLAFGGPVAIWIFVQLWRVAAPKVQVGAQQGVKVGRLAVDELSKRSARATKDVVGAVAQISDNAQGRTRECPFCAEMIKPRAKVCRHCGNEVA